LLTGIGKKLSFVEAALNFINNRVWQQRFPF